VSMPASPANAAAPSPARDWALIVNVIGKTLLLMGLAGVACQSWFYFVAVSIQEKEILKRLEATAGRLDDHERNTRREMTRQRKAITDSLKDADVSMQRVTAVRNELWGEMARKIGVPPAKVQEILERLAPPVNPHSNPNP
jgi:hypothetical protein